MRETVSVLRQGSSAPPDPLGAQSLDRVLCERFLAAGMVAGFDMTTPEGIAAWTAKAKRLPWISPPPERSR